MSRVFDKFIRFAFVICKYTSTQCGWWF